MSQGYMLTLAIGGVAAQSFNPKMVFGLSVALSVVPAVFEQGIIVARWL